MRIRFDTGHESRDYANNGVLLIPGKNAVYLLKIEDSLVVIVEDELQRR